MKTLFRALTVLFAFITFVSVHIIAEATTFAGFIISVLATLVLAYITCIFANLS